MIKRNKNTAELNLKGVPANLLEHLKSNEDYICELGDTIANNLTLTQKYGSKFKKGEEPEEIKQNLTRSSELVLLIEFTQQFDLLRK